MLRLRAQTPAILGRCSRAGLPLAGVAGGAAALRLYCLTLEAPLPYSGVAAALLASGQEPTNACRPRQAGLPCGGPLPPRLWILWRAAASWLWHHAARVGSKRTKCSKSVFVLRDAHNAYLKKFVVARWLDSRHVTLGTRHPCRATLDSLMTALGYPKYFAQGWA